VRTLQFTLAFLIFLGPVFFRFPAKTFDFLPSLRFYYYESLEKGGTRSILPPGWAQKSIRPYNAVSTRRGQDQILVSPEREKKFSAEEMLAAPIHGEGYFVYGRVGKEMKYFTRDHELLWSKPYVSYPVPDPTGKIVFLFTGDANRVDVIDPSGNPVGVRKISGNFLTHYSFSMQSGRSAFVFGTGGLTVLDAKGNLASSYDPGENLFFKSVALSADGTKAAVHALFQDDAGERDLVRLLDLAPQARVTEEYVLERVVPANIALAVANSGSILIGLPEKILSAHKGKLSPAGREASLRYALGLQSYSVISEGDRASVFMPDGALLASLPVQSVPFQFLPGPVPDTFLIRSFSHVIIAGVE
jgi:hypothetical protein